MKNGSELPIESLQNHIVFLSIENPKKVALLQCNEDAQIVKEITYEVLAQEIEKAAGYLAELGLKKENRVALAFKNSPELLILSWAAWASGIVTVPMDTKRDTGELYKYKLELNKVKVLIAQGGVLKDIDSKFLTGVEVVNFVGFPDTADKSVEWQESLAHRALILLSAVSGKPTK